ncbi:MAG: fibronectin type III domain-containing protein [Thermoplasmata archaeon]|nr:fibronectin type III domain-containing protein [Thermoplasmata archaeon]
MVRMKSIPSIFKLLTMFLVMMFAISFITVPYTVSASTEAWFDDFDGTDLNPRWTRGGIGLAVVDQDTYLVAQSFTGVSDNDWFGPYVRTEIPASGYFDITVVLNCIAESGTSSPVLARTEIRLLNPSAEQVYAFGWGDRSEPDNRASIYLNGGSDSDEIYDSNAGFLYSNFIDKSIRLVRNENGLSFYIEGGLVHTDNSQGDVIQNVDLAFLRFREYPQYCTPEVIDFNSISLEATPATEPGQLTDLSCDEGDSQATLSWSVPSDGGSQITSYRIYRGESESSLVFLTSKGDTPSFVDTDLVNGQEYFYAVSAVNYIGEGNLSDTASVTPITVPDAPINLQAIAGVDYVYLSWEPPVDNGGSTVISYSLYRGSDTNTMELLDSMTSLYHNDTGPSALETYYYAVSATNSVGGGTLSEAVKATLGEAPTVPTEPRGLQAMPGDGQATLTWKSPLSNGNSKILNYILYRGIETTDLLPISTLGPSLNYTDTGLQNNQTYYYRISAVNIVGESQQSSIVNVTPFLPLPPDAPTALVTTPFNTQALLQWTVPVSDGGLGISGYIIYRGDDADNMEQLIELASITSYMDIGLDNGHTYYYQVSCTNDAGESQLSNIANCMPIGSSPVNDSNYTPPTPSTGLSLTSPIVTVIILAVVIIGVYFYIRKSPEKGE